MSGMSDMSDMSDMSGMSNMSDMSGMSGMSDMSDMSNMSDMSDMSVMSDRSYIHNSFSSFTLHPSRWYLQVPLLTSPLHTTATNKSYKFDMSKLIFFLHSPSATGLRTDSVLVPVPTRDPKW